jgi:DNA-binding XRE family transcriptional regulator
MSEEPEFFTYTREEFLDEFVHPDDRPAVEEARQRRTLQVRAEYLTEMRKKAGLTQAEVAEPMGVSQQRVSAIESGAVTELATLDDYIRALGGYTGVQPSRPASSASHARSGHVRRE